MRERNVASEKTERKQKRPENLSMCCNVSGQSWMNSIKRKGFAFEKSAEFIGSELL